jgi:hypothetical protein
MLIDYLNLALMETASFPAVSGKDKMYSRKKASKINNC